MLVDDTLVAFKEELGDSTYLPVLFLFKRRFHHDIKELLNSRSVLHPVVAILCQIEGVNELESQIRMLSTSCCRDCETFFLLQSIEELAPMDIITNDSLDHLFHRFHGLVTMLFLRDAGTLIVDIVEVDAVVVFDG